MKTMVSFDQAAYFFRFHPKNRVFKRLDHHATSEKTKITAVGCGARILRMLPGNLRKALWRLLYLRKQLLGLGTRCGLLLGRGCGWHSYQYMACTPLFRLPKFTPVLIKIFYGFVGGNLQFFN